MDEALPPVASWSNPTVPRYLPPADLERLLGSIRRSGTGLRDRAALLLLGRLGLRAGDVVRLRLSDIDFGAGTLVVAGKGRRREVLPLPQDVGDALISYLQNLRPRVKSPEVFLTVLPPVRPMSTQALGGVVARTLDRAGISAPTRGCHLLRHSAATSMLRRGASLAGVGRVLRHLRPATTVKYAKADDCRLLAVAQPWPGQASC
jgi:integrase/recombinase XerD